MDASLELKKHVGAIHVKGALTLLQRKAVNALLLNAYHELPDETVKEHSIRLVDLADALGYNSNDHDLLKDTIETLVETKVRWNVLDKDGQEGWGVSGLLASAVTRPRSGTCQYAYSVHLRRLLYNPAVYARINLAVQSRFTSQYALALYENCLRFVGVGSTGWLPVADWRGLLGVGADQYRAYKAFRQHVLAPAAKQVNAVGHIRVELETRREGRKIAELRFTVRPGVPLLPESAEIEEADSVPTSGEAADALPARLAEFGLTARQVEEAAALPPDQVERNLRYVRGQIARGTKVGRLGAYAYRAVTEDWAGADAAAQQTQTSLFDADAPDTPAPAPSPAALDEAARREAEAQTDAALRQLDARIDALGTQARRALDAEAVRALREGGHPGWRDVQEAAELGQTDDLGPALTGALRNARRDAMTVWLSQGAAVSSD
ncbi:replication initiation protein [Rubrivirga sp. S365]|uniref:replication initiation protein n=1 Tax=Rubrivirga sp. S365 TaxID=3076080 RepID=UPI0028C71478|nr:replication initiation protein [Rubrivirga sp. S365]MDT7858147.1 replication initiation protein [Rubrivirga sp. S365]